MYQKENQTREQLQALNLKGQWQSTDVVAMFHIGVIVHYARSRV